MSDVDKVRHVGASLGPFIQKLIHSGQLLDEDRQVLARIGGPSWKVRARADIISEGENPSDVNLILSGFAVRYKLLPDGRRSIVAYLVPGDICDLHIAILDKMDHGIAALTDCDVVKISKAAIEDLTERHPRINRALWWGVMQDEAILREWLVSMGRREAAEQVAHLLCELLVRLRAVGLADANSYQLPITQEDLADTAGLSTIHVNRVLQSLRSEGLIELDRKGVRIPDVARLETFADFDPSYLHLQGAAGSRG